MCLISDDIVFNNLFQDFLNKSWDLVSSNTYTNFKHKPNNGIYGKNGNYNSCKGTRQRKTGLYV